MVKLNRSMGFSLKSLTINIEGFRYIIEYKAVVLEKKGKYNF
jgi:hypothetical protein